MSAPNDATRQAMWSAMIVAALMIGQVVAGKAVRDGFFLTHFPASALPTVMTGASLLSVAIVLGSARLYRWVAPGRVLPFLFAGSAGLFVGEWALSFESSRLAAAVLYLHTTSLGAVVVSGFWSVVNERFDPHTAKQVIARIGGGASLGGVLGGLAAWGGALAFDIATMIVVLAALHGLCAVGVREIGAPARARVAADDAGISVLEILQETPYLRQLALLVGLVAFTGAVFDYVFKARADAYFADGAELVSFFALFYLSLGLLSLVVQNLAARRSLLALGLAVTVGMLPVTLVALGLLALLLPGIATATAMRGGSGAVESSLYRSGYELLYTPLAPEKKRPTKTLVDVGGDKLGAAAGAGFAFFVLGIFPDAASPILLAVGIGAGVAALFVTRRLHQGYVGALADSLHSGSLDASGMELVDATTRRTVSATVMEMKRAEALEGAGLTGPDERRAGLDRGALLDRLRRSPASRGAPGAPLRRPFVEPPRPPPDTSEIDDTVVGVVDLRSGDPARIEAALRTNHPLPGALVPHVIPLLAREDVAEAAAAALRRVAPAHVGALFDAVVRSRTPLAARRRLCEILGSLATQRCANGFVELLQAEPFELRFRAASALLRNVRANPELRVPREPLFEAAQREALDCRRRWRNQLAVDGKLTRAPALDSVHGRRVVQGVSFIFTLLLTVLDREPLSLALRALAEAEGAQRGTGLEYLDNVLPDALKEALWPLLEDPRLALGPVRSRAELLDELALGSSSEPPDLAAVRERVDARRR